MKTLPAGVLEHFRNTAWGLRPETLRAIVAVLTARTGDVAGQHHIDLTVDAEVGAANAGPLAGIRPTTLSGGVAILPLKGLITPQGSFLSMIFGGGGGLRAFREQLREAIASEDVSAVVIDIDSPGGSTDLVAETAAEIRAARELKPVIAVANTWAASAAYWLGAQADELIVTPSGEVGSIGVFMLHEEFSAMDERIGIKSTLISAGKYKTEGNAYEPLSDEARAAFQAKIDAYYDMFVADVAAGRNIPEASVRGGFGEGRMVTATQAVQMGMADRIDTLEATIANLVRNPPRPRQATAPRSEGNPAPNPSRKDGEEATAGPSQSYIDLMYDATR